MAGTEHLREILTGAAEKLRAAQLDGQNLAREDRLQRAAGYARGVLDALAAVMADEDDADADAQHPDHDCRIVVARDAARRPRDGSGRFLPKSDGEAARERAGGQV